MAFTTEFTITWGDCDPGGIVFYPRFFYWFDTTFQRWLQNNELSQAVLQQRYGIIGTGIIDTRATFRSPLKDGDVMQVAAQISNWSAKSFRIDYTCTHNGVDCAEGYEVRGWFKYIDGRLRSDQIPEEFRQELS
ncbi:MAG: thioesterase family protein [Pseudomonadota bacterium]